MKLKTLFVCGALAVSSSAIAAGSYTNSFDSVSSSSTADAVKNKNSIGIAVASFDQLYSGLENRTTALPLFNLKYNRFFLKGFDLGFNAYQSEQLTTSVILKPVFNGYKEGDSDELNGMDDRGASAYLGAQVNYRMKPLNYTLFVAQDVSGRTKGTIGGAKVGTGLPVMGGKVILAPSLSATYWNTSVVDYYYGVKDSEVTNSRAAYSPEGTWVYNGSLTAMYRFKTNLMARLTYSYSYYDAEIEDSPGRSSRGRPRRAAAGTRAAPPSARGSPALHPPSSPGSCRTGSGCRGRPASGRAASRRCRGSHGSPPTGQPSSGCARGRRG